MNQIKRKMVIQHHYINLVYQIETKTYFRSPTENLIYNSIS